MKIAAYTIGDIGRASSRLRSFYLFSLADEYNLEVIRPISYRDALNCDVVHLQKILSCKLILWVLVYRLFGLKVIYDLDDKPSSNKAFWGFFTIMLLSSVITLNTEAHKTYWIKYLFYKKIVVINDIADTNDCALSIKNRRCSVVPYSFFWIGYACNIKSIERFINMCDAYEDFTLIASTEESALESLKMRYRSVEFIPWYDGVAFDDRVNARFMILNHNLDKASVLKSDNKMVLAILAGFVPFVSRTPSYEKLANSLGCDFLVYDNIEEVPRIAANLVINDICSFFERSLNYIIANYSRKAMLSKFCDEVLFPTGRV